MPDAIDAPIQPRPDVTPLTGTAPGSPSLGVCLAFGVGTIGTAVLLNTVTVYLPAFMATVLGRSVALAGLLLTLSKLYDVVCDIVIGMASDRTRSRLGRRRPYMLAGALVGSLAFCMIFDPPLVSHNAAMWEMGFLLVLYSTGYSLFNVPYLALPPELAGDYHGRTRLLSYRTLFVSIGQLVGLTGSGWILHAVGGGAHGFAVMGYTLGAVILITELGTFFGLHKTVPAPVEIGGNSWASLGSMFSNRPFLLLMGAKFSQLLGVSVSISTSLLFMLNVLGAGYLGLANFSLAQNIAIAVSMPIWVKMGRRIGKRASAIVSVIAYATASLSWLFAGHGESTEGIVARGIVMGLAAGGILLMGSAMLPDVMEYDFCRSGQRREGIFSSCFAVLEKSAFALGPGLIGVYLSYAGYIPTMHGQLVAQPASVQTALYVCAAILPAALIMLSIIFLSFYNLNEAEIERMRNKA
jgi:GPH family glycoside/pentoside/hexuronide:cation symporter